MRAHSVSPEEATRICAKADALVGEMRVLSARSLVEGQVIGVDQVRLGNIVNFALIPSEATNRPGSNRSGLLLRKTLGDRVIPGEPLCTVYADPSQEPSISDERLLSELASCFEIEGHSSVRPDWARRQVPERL